jgi:hypothetical protein
MSDLSEKATALAKDERFLDILCNSLFIRYWITQEPEGESVHVVLLGASRYKDKSIDKFYRLGGVYSLAGRLSSFTPSFKWATGEEHSQTALNEQLHRMAASANRLKTVQLYTQYLQAKNFIGMMEFGKECRALPAESEVFQFHHGILAHFVVRELRHLEWLSQLEGQVPQDKVEAFKDLERRFSSFVGTARRSYLKRHIGE